MKLYERHQDVTQAGLDISEAIIAAVGKYNLTFGEFSAILSRELSSWAKCEIRDEREVALDPTGIARERERCAVVAQLALDGGWPPEVVVDRIRNGTGV